MSNSAILFQPQTKTINRNVTTSYEDHFWTTLPELDRAETTLHMMSKIPSKVCYAHKTLTINFPLLFNLLTFSNV